MSFRIWGNIKALFHFDYPYIHENGDALMDEVSASHEIFIKNGNVKFAGHETAEMISSVAPKFGYRCPYFEAAGDFLSTSHDNIIKLLKTGDCEIDFWLYHEASSSGNIISLKDTSGNVILALTDTNNSIKFTNSEGTYSINNNAWSFIRLTLSNNRITLFVNNSQKIYANLPSLDNLATFNIGSFKGYIDELLFRKGLGDNSIIDEPVQGILDINLVGQFGNSKHGNVTINSNAQINSYGAISAANGTVLTINGWNSGKYGVNVGDEVLIHVTLSKNNNYDLTGLYSFRRIKSISGSSYTLDSTVSEFDLAYALANYYVQAITVPNFKNFTLESNATITPASWDEKGGIVAFRTSQDCTIKGKIFTHGYGPARTDLLQMTHSTLIDRFVINRGGGIFIACGGTFLSYSDARLGASWDGALSGGIPVKKNSGGHGGAGYGGAGASESEGSALGGYGGVGGGGGGGDGYNGTSAGDFDTGGMGCNNNKNSFSNGGTQGKTPGAISSSTNHASGGGGALGNASDLSTGIKGGYSGACLILIADTLHADASSISTGGEGGYQTKHASGGGGTGLCYIACKGVN